MLCQIIITSQLYVPFTAHFFFTTQSSPKGSISKIKSMKCDFNYFASDFKVKFPRVDPKFRGLYKNNGKDVFFGVAAPCDHYRS